jgi:hypothetical protein
MLDKRFTFELLSIYDGFYQTKKTLGLRQTGLIQNDYVIPVLSISKMKLFVGLNLYRSKELMAQHLF